MNKMDIDASKIVALDNFHNNTKFEYTYFLEECPVT